MLLALLSGFIWGIAVASFNPISFGFFIFILLITGIIFGYRFFVEVPNKIVLTIVALFLIGTLSGIARINISSLYSESQLESFAERKIIAEGVIVGEPDVRESNTKLTISLRNVSDGTNGTKNIETKEKVLITVPIYPEFSYGDKVKIEVVLKEPLEFETDGRVFDYNGYLRARGIWYTGSFAKVDLISSGHGNMIKTFLYGLKKSFVDSINNVLPEPESSLLSGLLLGSKQSLGKELLEEFQRTGVSHIVVLSGANIVIVAQSIMSFFKFLPKNFSFTTGAIGVILFTTLSGAGASGWRATIMVLVALLAKRMNRDYKSSRVLGFTIVLMLAPNPLLLAFDPSFQLSVLATIGLIFVTPHVSPYLEWITERYGMREIVSSTIATQITVLPYLIYNMGLLSFVSLPVNILILGTIPLTMLLGFITGITGFVSLYLAFIPAFFTYILLWYQLAVVHIGARFPFGAIELPAFSPIIVVLIYAIIFGSMYFLKNRKTIVPLKNSSQSYSNLD